MNSLNDFEILCETGKGAFGYVYKVKRIKDNEIYALKKVNMNKLNSKEKENSLNEIRILASISHANVISYKESFYDSFTNCICIVMEFADSGDLEKKINNLIKQKIYMTESEIISLFVQIVLGLKSLHDKKIMHRDIKSANIFLFKDNIVKIGDLNVSKVIKVGLVHTQTGTPYYASPEVWNDKPYDYKSDIWSLGCLLYEMTTLKAPFRGTSMKAVYEKVMKGVYDPIPNFYSKSLSGIIHIMLQINSYKRPSCDHILSIINEKMKFLKLSVNINTTAQPKLNVKEISSEKLLKTIKIPKKITELNSLLPKSRYIKRLKKIPSNINNSMNKTEIFINNNHDDDNPTIKNDISAIYDKKNNKLLEDLFDGTENKYPIEKNNKNNIDKYEKQDKSIIEPPSISETENELNKINKPILIKKNILHNIKRIGSLQKIINKDDQLKKIVSDENNNKSEKKILDNVNYHFHYNSLNKNNVGNDIQNQDFIDKSYFGDMINNQENNLNPLNNLNSLNPLNALSPLNITPTNMVKIIRPSSHLDRIPNLRNRNNSSNIKRIMNQEPSYSPILKKIDYSYIAPTATDNTVIHDNSYLPKILNNVNKININVFNQGSSSNKNSYGAVKILNSSNINQRSINLYPIKLDQEKDSYNFEIKNYNINNERLDNYGYKPKIVPRSAFTPHKLALNRGKIL